MVGWFGDGGCGGGHVSFSHTSGVVRLCRRRRPSRKKPHECQSPSMQPAVSCGETRQIHGGVILIGD